MSSRIIQKEVGRKSEGRLQGHLKVILKRFCVGVLKRSPKEVQRHFERCEGLFKENVSRRLLDDF